MWNPTADMNVKRSGHTATLLNDGKVLVAAGRDNLQAHSSAEIYDPTQKTWTYTGSLVQARICHEAVKLDDGKVLVCGGFQYLNMTGDLNTAEIYDFQTGLWTQTGPMNVARRHFGLILLPNGKALAYGGWPADSTAELYDPATNSWSYTGPLAYPWGNLMSQAIVLPDGNVLLSEGYNSPITQVYDPIANSWTLGPNSLFKHTRGFSCILQDGGVLMVGGESPFTQAAEIFNPSSGGVSTASLNVNRSSGFGALLKDGKVLIVGGYNELGFLNSAELYDPQTKIWSPAGNLRNPNGGRYRSAITLLKNGDVMVSGGAIDNENVWKTVDVYGPYEVTIDIKPGEEPNSINLGSNGNVPVAIFSTEEFDATQIDPFTVTLAGATVKIKGKADLFMTLEEDLNGDGLMDLLVHIDTTVLTLSASDTEAVLTGNTYDGMCIRGTDTVRIVPQ